MTKKTKADAGAEGGSKGKNCPCLPKPPNTAKAIADKAGHRSPARARIDASFRQFCQKLGGTAHPAREARRQEITGFRSITMVVTGEAGAQLDTGKSFGHH